MITKSSYNSHRNVHLAAATLATELLTFIRQAYAAQLTFASAEADTSVARRCHLHLGTRRWRYTNTIFNPGGPNTIPTRRAKVTLQVCTL